MLKTISFGFILFIFLVQQCIVPVNALGKESAGLIKAKNDCDLYAASSIDPQRPPSVNGVGFYQVKHKQAIPACEKAIQLLPAKSVDIARIYFNYGRALHAAGRSSDALKAYEMANEKGHAVAANNIASILEHGTKDIKKDLPKAVELYKKASGAGIAMAQANLARLYRNGTGLPADSSKALELYKSAALGGYNLAHRYAAQILEEKDRKGGPDYESAAPHWRALAKSGNVSGALELAERLENGKIKPQDKQELVNVYQSVADKGNRKASYQVAQLMSKTAKKKQQAYKALSYAYKALDRTKNSTNKTDEGWPIYLRASAEQIVKIVTDFKLVPRDKKEYESLKRDYATPGGMKRFTVPIDCGQQNKNFPYEVYVWNWRKDYSPVQLQAEWLQKVRGCKFPKDTLDKFNEAAKLAREKWLPLAEVTAFKLGGKEVSEKAKAKLNKILERRKIAAAKYRKRKNPDYYIKTLINLENYPVVAECKAKNKKLYPFAIPVDKALKTISRAFRDLQKMTKQFPKYFPTNRHGLKAAKIFETIDDCAEKGNKDIYLELHGQGAAVRVIDMEIIAEAKRDLKEELKNIKPEDYLNLLIILPRNPLVLKCKRSSPYIRQQSKSFDETINKISKASVKAKKLTSDKLTRSLYKMHKLHHMYRRQTDGIIYKLNKCNSKSGAELIQSLQFHAAILKGYNQGIIKSQTKALKK